ncbi:MAG: ABC transporter permease [Candidatus Nanopelagicales bacterium]
MSPLTRGRSGAARPVVALPRWVLLPSLAWLTLFFVIPVIGVFVISVGTPVGYSGVQLGFDLSSFEKVFSSTFLGVFVRTIGLAVVGTTLVFLIGFPTAYWLARYGGRRKYLILAILVIPFWTSFIVRTFAWLIVLSPDWFVVRAIESTGVVESFRPLGTIGAVGMVVVYNYLPLALLPLYATLERMNWSMVEAAEDLGATGRGAFFQVTLPSIRAGIITSGLLVFVPMTGEYVIPQIIGSGKQALFANLIGQQFLQAQNWPLGAALAAFLIVVVGVTAVIVLLLAQRKET